MPEPSAPPAAAPLPRIRPRSRRRGLPPESGAAQGPAAAAAASLPLLTVAAGFPSPADDYAETRIDLNLELIPHPLSTFFMRVCGDAMAADGILDGDLLVIDRSVPAREGLVVVVTHAGAFLVRRLQRSRATGSRADSGSWQLVASDGLTPPLHLAEGVTEIWGVVIHAVHHLAAAPSRRR